MMSGVDRVGIIGNQNLYDTDNFIWDDRLGLEIDKVRDRREVDQLTS